MHPIKRIGKNLRRWRTMIIAYFFVFLIPFFILSGVVQQYLMRNLTQQTVSRSAMVMVDVMNSLDNLYSVMQISVSKCKFDTDILASYSPQQLSAVQQLISLLLSIRNQSDFFEDVWYYCEDDQYLYSSTTSHTREYFLEERYSASGSRELKDLLEYAVDTDGLCALDRQKDENVVLFFMPFQKLAYEDSQLIVKRHLLIFVVLKDYLNEQLDVLLQTKGEASLYLNGRITVRLSSPREQDESLLDATGQVDLTPILSTETIQIFSGQTKINSQWYSVMEAHSSISDWRMEAVIRDDYITNTRLQLIWTVALAAILGFSLVMTLLATRLIQLPFKKLTRQVHDIARDYPVKKRFQDDGYDEIESFITSISSENMWLRMNMDVHRTAAQQFLIFSLFKGKIDSLEDFNRFGQKLNLHMSYASFDVITVIMESKDAEGTMLMEARDAITSLMRDQGGAEVFFQRTVPNYVLNVMICYDPRQYTWFSNNIRLLHSILNAEDADGVVIGIGSNRERTREIPLAHMQAILACNDKLFSPSRIVYEYDEERVPDTAGESLDTLENALYGNNYVYMAEALQGIADEINQETDLLKALHMAQDMLYMIAKWMDKANVREPLKEFASDLYLPNYQSPAELARLCVELHDEFLRRASLAGAQLDVEPTNQYCLYVQKNFDSPAFSIKQMADEFHLPLSTLSKYFLQGTGERLIDYVTRLRMTKAIQLLLESDMTIRKIGMSVGYYDVNSFIRRFKAYVGTTPNAYRQNQHQQS